MRNFGVGNDLMSIPQPSLIIPTSTFDRPVPRPIEDGAPRGKRSLAQTLSDPPEPAAKRTRKTEEQGACRELVTRRKKALKCCDDFVKTFVVARENQSKLLQKCHVRIGKANPHKAACQRYDDLVTDIANIKIRAPSWGEEADHRETKELEAKV